MDITFQYFTWCVKILVAVGCDKLLIYAVITRATAKKTVQKSILKNIINKSTWNS